ncbi:uncharacterized protein L969DRAFT_91891 [Mixia osmundae IAM 14324]|uniref:1-(5-phosphoribosyl)-5-[(5-phosphoribosylamino)methylideneamino] imidazole-4-carboxamide isomerase n=1 Tax=Mixia osmundae (strain CBS 9802 / IAM 14324 / JCM 22182 / KY 12970) TaxID=764103 RepID=G7E381_MIXOS|nr:uncharacterized protein L969DRAFT_91891 [Mixia osmundae IAM 14324]KEI42449.1 hypothetical protein L969DRAFT_91891 [Mixia osmundae IAM 14324]GAA97262.1 hypothetical protein E5Q_03939 [Mixia osmundae IAM 14324]
MTIFRPCIDIHNGAVTQIVGGTLDTTELKTNFIATRPSTYYAELYKQHALQGGHVIKLGPGNDIAARAALQAWPDALQIGGGIDVTNAQSWLESGASKVIVTSYLFPSARFDEERLARLSELIGKDRLVIDISCRRREDKWIVAMNRWQLLTDMEVTQESINLVSKYCSELLVHAADVEGLCRGIDEDLVQMLGQWCSIPVTYAGGAKHISDLDLVHRLSKGKVDLTFGSALDIFGGDKVRFDELIAWRAQDTQA